jgi:putative zinc finger/helix-turn-helix YgiT family protein
VDKVLCPECDRLVDHRVETRTETYRVRDDTITVKAEVAVCSECGGDISIDEFDDATLRAAFAEYRRRHNLMQPEEIKRLRSRYGLGQKAFARLLGWGDVTLSRYETGSLQSDAHESALRLAEDPSTVRRLLAMNGHKLSRDQTASLEACLEELESASALPVAREDRAMYSSGQSSTKLAEMLVFFAGQPKMWRTKLNKTLFYADFLHCKRHGAPITGALYAHMQFGPVPADFYGLQTRLVADESIDEVLADEGDCTGTLFVARRSANESVFSAEETETIRFVAAYFAGWSASRISRYSHAEPAWTETVDREVIPYSYAETLRLS